MKFTLTVLSACFASIAFAQPSFSDGSSLLNNTTNSGGCVGVTDMNGDGLDDIIILDNSRILNIEYQQNNGSFVLENYGNVSGSAQWGMCIGDVDQDGHLDVFSGGSNDGTRIIKISSPGNSSSYNMNNNNIFVQGTNMADVNNDGWLDVYACNDVGLSTIWGNNGNGNFSDQTNWIDMVTTPSSDNSGNYGSVWTDIDNDGDLDFLVAKCRQGVSNQNDPRRINTMFINDGNNNYTEEAAARGFVTHTQSWTVDAADIDNDGDFDILTTNHDNTLKLLENDGNGYFTDITAGSGLEITGFFLQAMMRDFDNDGLVDILIAGGIHRYFTNNGDQTFSQESNTFPHNDVMHSYGIGDLNTDGYLDLFSSYGNSYVTADNNNDDMIWMNDGGNNNWFGADLIGTISNVDAVGARTELYGPWGVQVREVRAGESYGIVNSFKQHFGIGTATEVDSMMIYWPSGIVETFRDLDINTYITVIENECVAPIIDISTPNNSTTLCAGQSLDLTADAGVSYEWSTGETSQTISVDTEGTYSVLVDDGSGCFGNASLFISASTEPQPVVSLDDDATFCQGGSVMLTAPASDSYLWSNNETTQSIEVSTSGQYYVSVPGDCGLLQSEDIEITVMPAPGQPTANDVIIAPGTAELTSTGSDIHWYDAANGGNEVGQGSPWTTPFLNTTTTYWVADGQGNPGVVANAGLEDNDPSGQYHGNTANWIEFDATTPFILNSVKVYADGGGNRTIELVDNNENVLESITVNIPDGEQRVDLNFDVPVGNGMGLRGEDGADPQLWRDNAGGGGNLGYPFDLNGMGEIYGSTAGSAQQYYYFFYEWEIESYGTYCESPREDVVVTIDTSTGIEDMDGLNSLNIFPNPANEMINISMDLNETKDTRIELIDATGRLVFSKNLNSIVGSRNETIDVSSLSKGVYSLNIVLNGQITSRKVMVD